VLDEMPVARESDEKLNAAVAEDLDRLPDA
jgi:hypothetical protein